MVCRCDGVGIAVDSQQASIRTELIQNCLAVSPTTKRAVYVESGGPDLQARQNGVQ